MIMLVYSGRPIGVMGHVLPIEFILYAYYWVGVRVDRLVKVAMKRPSGSGPFRVCWVLLSLFSVFALEPSSGIRTNGRPLRNARFSRSSSSQNIFIELRIAKAVNNNDNVHVHHCRVWEVVRHMRRMEVHMNSVPDTHRSIKHIDESFFPFFFYSYVYSRENECFLSTFLAKAVWNLLCANTGQCSPLDTYFFLFSNKSVNVKEDHKQILRFSWWIREKSDDDTEDGRE